MIGEDAHVLAQAALIAKHVTANVRLNREQICQRLADGYAGGGNRTAGTKISQMADE